MSQNKYLKRIQTRIRRKRITISYQQIRDIILENFEDIDLDEMTDSQVTTVSEYILQNHKAVDVAIQETALKTPHQDEVEVDNSSGTLAPTSKSDLSHTQASQIQQLAPQEAIAIIQDIAADDTSRNQELAGQLLTQLNEKTDTMVALIAAMPEIEAEMLRRKLHNMQRKRVDYEGILSSHFRNSQNLTTHIKDLVAEYGVSF